MCLWSEMGDAWNARREKLRIRYPMHRQKSQETGGFMKKTKHPTVCGPLPACPCVHCLCSEPSHRVWHRAVLTLHSHPGALPWGSVSCPPAHTALPGCHQCPPPWSTCQDVPSRTGTSHNFACGVFCKHLLQAGADPSHDRRKHLPLLCPPAQGRSLKLLSQHLVK